MPGATFLEGESVELRTIEAEDAEAFQTIVNHPQVREGTRRVEPVSGTDEEHWIESLGDDEVALAICVDADGGPFAERDGLVGVVGLLGIDDRQGTAELGYQLHPDAWGNGYATDAATTLVRYAFEERGLEKLTARTVETNAASQRVLEKVGFVEEGVFREQVVWAGERRDMHWFGLLAEEWDGRNLSCQSSPRHA